MINVLKLETNDAPFTEKLRNFEESFRYPLGENRLFSISHGDDYGRFFRSIGKSRIYAACDGDEILGSLAVVRRPLMLNGHQQPALYIGDLKIKQGAGKVLYCLIKEAHDDNIDMREQPQFGVMMKGTPRKPSDYTGRLGLPQFHNMGEIVILRIPTKLESMPVELEEITLPEAITLSQELHSEDNILPIGRPAVRSRQTPAAFCLKNKKAVAILEDMLSAKRLFAENGQEIISGHLSSFQYDKPLDGVQLIQGILPEAMKKEYPALFVSIPMADLPVFQKYFSQAICAPAFIYGRNMEVSNRWQVNTSEI